MCLGGRWRIAFCVIVSLVSGSLISLLCSFSQLLLTAVENIRPPIPPDFRDSRLDALFDCWWNRDPGLRPEFRQIVDSVQALYDDAEEGALEHVRRRSQRLSMSPQVAHSPEFLPVAEHAAMSFDGSPPVTSPTSRESSLPSVKKLTIYSIYLWFQLRSRAVIKKLGKAIFQRGFRRTLATFTLARPAWSMSNRTFQVVQALV